MKKPKAGTKRGSAKVGDGAYQPRMRDPVSGAKLIAGRPVPAAAGKPVPPAPAVDYTKLKTTRPVERVPAGPLNRLAGIAGRVKDPISGAPMKAGRPVPAQNTGKLADTANAVDEMFWNNPKGKRGRK